jgi:hypothetical protein
VLAQCRQADALRPRDVEHVKLIKKGDFAAIKWWEQSRMGWRGDGLDEDGRGPADRCSMTRRAVDSRAAWTLETSTIFEEAPGCLSGYALATTMAIAPLVICLRAMLADMMNAAASWPLSCANVGSTPAISHPRKRLRPSISTPSASMTIGRRQRNPWRAPQILPAAATSGETDPASPVFPVFRLSHPTLHRPYAETPSAKCHLRPAGIRHFLCRENPCRNQSFSAWNIVLSALPME